MTNNNWTGHDKSSQLALYETLLNLNTSIENVAEGNLTYSVTGAGLTHMFSLEYIDSIYSKDSNGVYCVKKTEKIEETKKGDKMQTRSIMHKKLLNSIVDKIVNLGKRPFEVAGKVLSYIQELIDRGMETFGLTYLKRKLRQICRLINNRYFLGLFLGLSVTKIKMFHKAFKAIMGAIKRFIPAPLVSLVEKLEKLIDLVFNLDVVELSTNIIKKIYGLIMKLVRKLFGYGKLQVVS